MAYAFEMRLRVLFRRFDSALGRFNRWLAPAALTLGTTPDGRAQQADAGHVAAILGELEQPNEASEPRDPQRPA
jgi:hypothetical protein